MQKPFSKYVGCGNDFILFDNRQADFPAQNKALIQNLCHRHKGIGADGIILLENSAKADFKMRIFNSDGSEAEMCGNGIRCFMKFLESLGFTKPYYQIETMHRILRIEQRGPNIAVEMGSPTDVEWNFTIPYENQLLMGHYMNTGVPHYVLFEQDIDKINLKQLGPYIRYHAKFNPKGTNVNVAEKMGSKKIKIRTYERGVEGETLACGTGATAVALAAAKCYAMQSPIQIETSLGDELTIEFSLSEDKFSNVAMAGPATCTYEGIVNLETIKV